jgi:hypothetical protein
MRAHQHISNSLPASRLPNLIKPIPGISDHHTASQETCVRPTTIQRGRAFQAARVADTRPCRRRLSVVIKFQRDALGGAMCTLSSVSRLWHRTHASIPGIFSNWQLKHCMVEQIRPNVYSER